MIFSGEIKFKNIEYKLRFWKPSEKTKFRILPPQGSHNPVLGTSQGIHPTHSYEWFRRKYTASTDPATDDVFIIDHTPIFTATQRQNKTFDYDSWMTFHERMRKLRREQKEHQNIQRIKISKEIAKKLLNDEY